MFNSLEPNKVIECRQSRVNTQSNGNVVKSHAIMTTLGHKMAEHGHVTLQLLLLYTASDL